MQMPSNLTRRERQILPFLLSGATRNEISKTLEISPDTVKAHVKNLLRKFDALTVRDAYTDIEIYQRFYGEGGLGFDSYMISNELKFMLLPGRKFAKIERKDHVCPVNVGVKKWTRRYLLGKGSLETNLSSDCACDYWAEVGFKNDVWEYTLCFAEPQKIRKGFHVFEQTTVLDHFDRSGGFDRISSSVPVQTRHLVYEFQADDLPKEVEMTTRVNLFEVKVDFVEGRWHENRFIVDVKDFMAGLMIELTWKF